MNMQEPRPLITQLKEMENERKIAMMELERERDVWMRKCQLLEKDLVIMDKDNALLKLRLEYECGSA